QGADVRAAALRICPADDNELFAVEALRLHPDSSVTRRIGLIGALRNGALEAELAGAGAEAWAVAGDVLAVAQTSDILPEQTLELRLALEQRQSGGALAVQEQEMKAKNTS